MQLLSLYHAVTAKASVALGRDGNRRFVRGLGIAFTPEAKAGWDVVIDAAVMQQAALALVRDGGAFVGVQPGAVPTGERGISTTAVVSHPDGGAVPALLPRVAIGKLPARVHSVIGLGQLPEALPGVARGGTRGRHVVAP